MSWGGLSVGADPSRERRHAGAAKEALEPAVEWSG